MHTHLLVVDDDESIRTTLAVILQRDGRDVACAADGKEALGRMRDHPPDLVLLDLMMPGMGGWDVLAAMRESPSLAEIPVVVLTSLHDDAHAPPGQPVLHKPVDDAIVRAVVDTLLAQRRGLAFAIHEPPSDLFPRHALR
jgi:CheY-like chemotaxis protein